MLSPKNRLRHSAEFGSVMRAGQRSTREALGVIYLAPPQDEQPSGASREAGRAAPPRVGFVVSKAVGGAVVRNRVQRKLRHLMRSRLSVMPSGSLLVVRAKSAAAAARSEELAVQLDSAIAAAMRPRGSSRRRRGRERSRHSAMGRSQQKQTSHPRAGGERWAGR